MLLPRRIKLLLATGLAASSLTLVIATHSANDAPTESKVTGPTLKSKILRRKDRLNEKPNAYELALLRKHATVQEERHLEDKIPAHLPIKIKIKSEKEKAFKDLDNEYWLRDLKIEVKNTGTRPIYYLVLLIDLPEAKINDGNLIFRLQFGDDKFMNFAPGATSEDLSLKPGETCLLALRGDDKNLSWRAVGKMQNWPVPKKVRLLFQEISFGDGTGFRTGGGIAWPARNLADQRLAWMGRALLRM